MLIFSHNHDLIAMTWKPKNVGLLMLMPWLCYGFERFSLNWTFNHIIVTQFYVYDRIFLVS